jgi:hypothetical protein
MSGNSTTFRGPREIEDFVGWNVMENHRGAM